MYIDIESLCLILETNTILYVNYSSIARGKKRNVGKKTKNGEFDITEGNEESIFREIHDNIAKCCC